MLLVWRVGVPVRNAARHRLRVGGVVREGPTAVSIYVTGRDLERLNVESGQFFLWRFVTRNGWWQAHPYSISAAPNPNWIRITAKEEGDHNRGLAHLSPGTRVIAEGPYGAFTPRRKTQPAVLMIAGGIGITPLRALLETFASSPCDLILLYRASTPQDLVFQAELETLAQRRGVTVHFLVGPRGQHPDPLHPSELLRVVPDVARREAFVCGPPEMITTVRHALHYAGVPRRHIHAEEFAY